MRSLRNFAVAIALIAVSLPAILQAHSGRTDANGCHTNKKTGDYHCHGAPKSSTSTTSPSSTPSQSFSSSLPKELQLSDVWYGKVVGVSDGDTIKIMHDGKPEVIRLYGVDCPEDSQAYSTQAKKFTSDQIFSKMVTVKQVDKDRYGRTVAEVILPDGSSLSENIVRAGYGWWYQKYAPSNKKLSELESRAKYFKVGLWADPNPIAPWEYRGNSNFQQPALTSLASPAPPTEQTIQVYRTKTGVKYHRSGCRSLSKSMIPVTVQEAKNMGLGPCSICKPPQ